MLKMLFISNIAGKRVGSFSLSSIKAATDLGIEYHAAANWNQATPEQIAEDENTYKIKIHHIDFRRNPLHPANFGAYKQLVALMKKEQFDMVHCNTPIGGVVGRLAAKKAGVDKVIYQAHGFHFYKGAPLINWLLYYPVERWLARMTDAIITINKEDYERAQSFHLRNKGKVYYVPGVGIDVSVYANASKNREALRKNLGFSPDDFVLISVGRLDKNKNNEVLIKTVGKIGNHVHLLLCGDGQERKSLLNLAKRNNCFGRVHFLGNRSDIVDLYKAADVFVMASRREGLSRSIMEAMASGLPCIVSGIRGNIDLIEDGVNGFTCDPTSIKEFMDRLRRLYEDQALQAPMRLNNQNKVNRFSIQAVSDKLIEIYGKGLSLCREELCDEQ